MSVKPYVSIVLPLYNRADLVEATLYSIIQQTYVHWEVIVIDDGSQDGSFEIVQSMAYKDSRIKLYRRNRAPDGAPTCRNIGVEEASGEYVIFLDSDDLLAPHCIQKRVEEFTNYPKNDFLVFSMLLFHRQPKDSNILWNIDTGEDDLTRFLRLDTVWQTACPMYKTAFLRNTIGFREGLPFWQDVEFHCQILLRTPRYKKLLHIVPDCYYRKHDQASISQQGFAFKKQLSIKVNIYKKIVLDIIHENKLTPSRQNAIIAVMFNFSRQLIIQQRDKVSAIQCWGFLKAHHLITTMHYKLGVYFLNYLYLHCRSNKKVSIYLLGYKMISMLILKKHKVIPSKLCQITYKSISKV
ncbi:glycosyltransferase family A protein [Porifericola rhodea]|uniref:glycosyltransferase family 2 protein n=1 Tax=Porifericola rhodea TaxID=930972 RepID=UPI00266635D0|nr:glycosyltransferase family A protein [Porifericola rhodea]WKN33486.1 glycosyltransferase family A protein [Porifericola rhodea]